MEKQDKALSVLVEMGYEFKFAKYMQDGFELYKKFALQYALFYFIILAISLVSNMVDYLGIVVDIILTPILSAGVLLTANELIKGNKPHFSFLFKGFSFFVPVLMVNLLSAVMTTVGLVLLIIPGIYLAVAYTFAIMFVLFLKYDYWSALEWSRKIISKNWWQFFSFLLVIVFLNLAGLLLCGVGILFTAPVSMCMLFCCFEDIIGGAIRNHQINIQV